MRHPQVLVYERDGLLANLLRRSGKAGQARKPTDWALREPRRLETCLRLLSRGGPSLLLLEVGHDLEREFTVLERVSWLHPETATVVVGDAEDAALAGLAWDLGASYVLFPPLPRDQLLDVIDALMARLAGTVLGTFDEDADA